MGRSHSRSPTNSDRDRRRDRSEAGGSSRRRSRSRRRGHDCHKSDRRRDEDRRKSDGDRRRNTNRLPSTSTSSASSSSSSRVQRGIDAAKNRLRASLGTAISDLKSKEPSDKRTTIDEKEYDFSSSLSVFDTLNRQKAIDDIEGNNYFVSTRFDSSEQQPAEDDDLKVHDRAMFGAMWMSKEIEKKMAHKNQSNRSGKK